MSTNEHAGLTVHGGTVHIGNAAIGTNPIAISVPPDQPALIRADDGALIDPDRLRKAVEDLAVCVATERQRELIEELQQAVTRPQPQRGRALELLGHFADGAATGEVVVAALGAVLGALGAQ